MSDKQVHKNASEFIRSMPADMKAAEVVEKAKAANWDIGQGLVYQVRAVQRRGVAKKVRGTRVARASKKGARARRAVATVAGNEPAFRKLAFELGINRSREVLNELEQRLREIVEG